MSRDEGPNALGVVLDRLQSLVEQARPMPLSASCLVNRDAVLELVGQARAALPASLVRAERLLDEREAVVEQGRREAERVVAAAEQERLRAVGESDVVQAARAEAGRTIEAARRDSDRMRAQVDDYVDGKLATFEIVLGKTLAAVERGREKLSGRHELDALREADDDGPPLPG